ncbi:unnamed protein product [Prorocentrum cordatum]|nr:unnamed protein product [Polarella glacialis]
MGGGGRGGSRGQAAGRGGRRRRPVGDRKYAVMDVLVWGDQDLAGAEAECRMFWLASRFSELREQVPRRARPLMLVPATPASPEALQHAYHSDAGYPKDSLLFLHRAGHYSVSEAVTPLVLLWRDRQSAASSSTRPTRRARCCPSGRRWCWRCAAEASCAPPTAQSSPSSARSSSPRWAGWCRPRASGRRPSYGARCRAWTSPRAGSAAPGPWPTSRPSRGSGPTRGAASLSSTCTGQARRPPSRSTSS